MRLNGLVLVARHYFGIFINVHFSLCMFHSLSLIQVVLRLGAEGRRRGRKQKSPKALLSVKNTGAEM